jgi:cyclin B
LERREVKRDKLQLVGCAAMLLASKYEEIYAPEVRDFVYISDQAYTREQILAMEEIMLRALQFDLTAPSTLKFADRFVKVTGHHNDERFKHMVNYLIELTLQDYRFVKYVPSMVAASAMFIALRTNSSHSMRDLAYTPLLERYTQYSKRALKECVSLMWKVLRADSPRYRAVRTKYSSRRFSDVARLDYSAANCSLFER